MEITAIRPRFFFDAPGAADDLIAKVSSGAALPERRCVCRVVGRHLDITVIREDRHRWSPCLSLELDQEESGVHVRGMIGPHPDVWTLFAFAYFSLAILLLIALTSAFAQYTLDRSPWALYAALACAVLLVVTYAASLLGRRLASEQTRYLMGVLEEILGVTLVP